jgi:hypothetical protein
METELMPIYGWAGPGETRRLDLDRATTPEVTEPTAPAPQRDPLHECQLCMKKFKKAMIMARHFNKTHEDLREDKDSWREYTKEILQ